MGERKYHYYVPFLAYVTGPEGSFIVPGYDFYEADDPIETREQIEAMRDHLSREAVGIHSLADKFIVMLPWKRIQ